ncbi:MAG TPA: hypothetical protein VGT41_00185 [Candidatus Babeliales bacterium]|nr:hypothetical protein [Candidatus Babeliales bacterium]
MYIKLDKISENESIVTYKFCIDVWEYDKIEYSNDDEPVIKEKIGIGRFNKQTDDLVIDWDRTDKYYLDKPRELFYIKWHIMKRKNLPVFPEKIHIATG